MTGTHFRRTAAALLVGMLAGCSLLTGSAPKLYRVTPVSSFPGDLPHRPAQLLVDLPLAPSGLDSPRIALTHSPVQIDYFADSEWTDRLPLVIETALSQSLENSHAITVIASESSGLRPDFLLTSEFRHFEAVYDVPDTAPTIWVAANVRLIRLPEHDIVAEASFERHVAAKANQMMAIVLAFDEALHGVTQDIVPWTVANAALPPPHR